MIGRLAGLALIAWALGFALFAVALPEPAGDARTDAIVVPTGAAGRIDRGLELLAADAARRMLVTGTAPGVRKSDLVRTYGHPATFACCVDLGEQAVDTRSNAAETAQWVAEHRYRSVRLVTSNWHARRADMELAQTLGSDITIVIDGVPSHPSLAQLLNEYHKLLLRRAVLWWEAWFGGARG